MPDYRNAQDIQNSQELGPGGIIKALQEARQRQQPFELQQQKAGIAKQEQERNLQQAQDIIGDQAKAGRNVKVKIGDVDVGQQEESPMKYLFRNQQANAHAMQHATDVYNKAFPEVQKRAQSAAEGLEAINDPQQIGSVGQAKTLMIKNLGMNRYNQQEGNALVPPNISSVIHQMYNSVGGESNPLSDVQRQALNSVFQNGLGQARKAHEMAKNNAVQAYSLSGLADPSSLQMIKGQIGSDYDKQLDEITNKYKQVPKTAGYQPGAAPPPGPLDKLKSFFGVGQSQSQPQPQQAQPAMSFEEFKAKKKAGQL